MADSYESGPAQWRLNTRLSATTHFLSHADLDLRPIHAPVYRKRPTQPQANPNTPFLDLGGNAGVGAGAGQYGGAGAGGGAAGSALNSLLVPGAAAAAGSQFLNVNLGGSVASPASPRMSPQMGATAAASANVLRAVCVCAKAGA